MSAHSPVAGLEERLMRAAGATAFRISLLAGRGVAGAIGDGGPATLAQLDEPAGLAVDRAGGVVVGEASNRVRYLAFGSITTVAGSGASGFAGDGGRAIDAQLNDPNGVAIDAAGGVLIADSGNHLAGQGDARVGDFAGDGGPATDALLNTPQAVLLDAGGNLLIADSFNGRVRRVDGDRIITTIAGGGIDTPVDDAPATSVRLGDPTSLAFDRAGGVIVGDETGHRVWRLTPTAAVPPSPGA